MDDLREMAKLPLVYPLTYGHPADGIPDRDDVIGSWSLKWREDIGKAEADIWLFDESKDRIDPAIYERIVNYQPVGVSPGYKYNKLTEDGAQIGTLPNHLAIARPDEEPRCPLGECGINVRFDSYKYDQILELEFVQPTVRTDTEETQEAEPAEAEPQPEPDAAPSEPAPVEDTPAVENTEEAVQEPTEPEQVQREPEVIIPASVKAHDDSGVELVDGYYRYVPKAYRDE